MSPQKGRPLYEIKVARQSALAAIEARYERALDKALSLHTGEVQPWRESVLRTKISRVYHFPANDRDNSIAVARWVIWACSAGAFAVGFALAVYLAS